MSEIFLGIISFAFSIQSGVNVYNSMKVNEMKYLEECVNDAVEYAYITYIYNLKQDAKRTKTTLIYDIDTAFEIAKTHFIDIYATPCFYTNYRISDQKIHKMIMTQLKFYYIKMQDKIHNVPSITSSSD